MSPQMVHQELYTSKTDVWSFGCIVYELLSLRKAFYGKDIFEIMGSIMKNKPKPIESIDTEFEFIINKYAENFSCDFCHLSMQILE